MKHSTAKRWLVSGRVQGVGFRYFVQAKAAELALTGWARNLDDGRVEVYAGGTPETQRSGRRSSPGPRISDVRNVEEKEDVVQRPPDFPFVNGPTSPTAR